MADIIKFPSSAKKIGDIAGDDFLLDLLYRAAMNPDSEITMEDYEKYKETGSFAEGGLASLPGYNTGGPAGFQLPTARQPKDEYFKIAKLLGFASPSEMEKDISAGIKKVKKGISETGAKLGGAEETAEINKRLQAKGYHSRYVGMPDELKLIEEELELNTPEKKNKFSNKLEVIQRKANYEHGQSSTKTKIKYITNQLSKLSELAGKNAKYILRIAERLGLQSFLGAAALPLDFMPMGAIEETYEQMLGSKEPQTLAGGGMMDIDTMTQPLGYYRGGRAGAPELDEGFKPRNTGYAEAVANINNPEYIHKWNMTKPRQPGLDEKLMQDYEPPIPRWGKAKDFIGELFGGRGAEGSEIPLKMELKMLIDQLRLAKGMEGSVVMPSSNQDQIKRLENRIQEIKIELYKSGQ